MEIKLQKWGNSYGIRIPSTILKSLNIKENDHITLKQEEDRIIISKTKKEKISLKEEFEKYKEKEIMKEFSWDDPVGEEIW